MSKAIDPLLRAHIQGETLTLAVCWHITRAFDGKEFFYTDHDRPLLVDGNTYNTANGFSRSAMKATADLSSQGMSVVGVFDNAEISEDDLIKGLFDNATIRIFVVNYNDLSQGILRYKYGRFGTVQRQSAFGFQVELLDLTQKLNQPNGEKRQPLCPARLGDKRCNNANANLPGDERNPVPIVAPERQDSTDYAVGDVIKVATGPDPITIQVDNIVNGGAETGDTTGWTGSIGALQTDLFETQFLPHSGSWMFRVPDSSIGGQIVDLRDLPDFIEANVDAGQVSAKRLSIWQAEYLEAGNQDVGRVLFYAVDGAGSDISTLLDTGYQSVSPTQPTANWHEVVFSGVLPSGTRQLRVEIDIPNNPGTSRVYHDDFTCTLTDDAQPANSSFTYEDRVYRCTVAGTSAASAPTYDTTIGNPTVDGTATFVAELAYMQAGEVQGVTDGRNFSALDTLWTDPQYDSPWFAFGGLVWETGANINWVSEVRSADPPNFTLKFATPFPIQPGDKFRVYPGCDLLRATCVAKWRFAPYTAARGNIDNFRGNADLPGIDKASFYPDAQS